MNLMMWLLVPPVSAAGVTVRPGDDINTLTSSLAPGSEVIFAGGTYELTDSLSWTGLGTAAAPIVLRAADGETPVLRYTGEWRIAAISESTFVTLRGLTFEGGEAWEEGNYSGLQIESSSDITVEDCTFRSLPSTAVYVYGAAANITLQRLHIYDVLNGAGIYAGCGDVSCWMQDSLIANNWIHDIGVGSDDDDGISLEHGDFNITVRDNVIYNTSRAGIVSRSTEYSAANVLTGNVVWNAFQYGIRTDGAATVQNNLVFLVTGKGIYSRNGDRDTLENAVISHNTIADTTDYGLDIEDWGGRTGMVLANNLVINPTGYGLDLHDAGDADATNYLSHNVISGLVSYDPELGDVWPDGVMPGYGYADVGDASTWNFYPTRESAALNTGDPSATAHVPGTDFNGAPREGDAPDVGAYERDGDTNPGWLIQEGFKQSGFSEAPPKVQGGCCEEEGKGGEAAALLLVGLGLARRRRREG